MVDTAVELGEKTTTQGHPETVITQEPYVFLDQRNVARIVYADGSNENWKTDLYGYQQKQGRQFSFERWLASFRETRERVLKEHSTVVHGGNKTGKTEILEFLEGDPAFNFIRIDWQGIKGYTETVSSLINEVAGNITNFEIGYEENEVPDMEGLKKVILDVKGKNKGSGKTLVFGFDEAQMFVFEKGLEEYAQIHRELVSFLLEQGIPFIDSLVDVSGEPLAYEDFYRGKQGVSVIDANTHISKVRG